MLTSWIPASKNFDCEVDLLEKLVKNVIKNGNGVQQAKLLKKLKDLTKSMLDREDPDSVEIIETPPSKKIKVNPRVRMK